MEAKEIKVVTPEPYYNITFGCSNRKFYSVKDTLWQLWEESGVDDDFNNGHYSEHCDYEGDLEKIIIYNNTKVKPFLEKVFEYYGGSFDELSDMNLVLSIY